MPSFDHEILVELLRRAPDVVIALLGALALPLPRETSATVVDRAFSEVSLSEIHADLVVLLRDEDRPRLVVIIEVQRTVDVDKDYTWPLYAAAARREHRCDVAVLVITQDPRVLERASEAIALGPGNSFRVFVVGPDTVPVPTGEEAQRRPGLPVLAALAHARSPDALELAERALFATEHLDEEHTGLYWDRILDALSESDRITLETRMSIGKIEYKSDSLQNLAVTLKAQGDLPGARRLYERALEARTRLLGEEHPHTLRTRQNLAGTLYAQGDLLGARRLYERVLEATTRLLGEEHPDTLRTLQNLAVTLKARGDLPGARRLYERALEAMTRLLGEEHPDTLCTLQNLAGTLYAQGDLPGARRLLERALEAMTRLLGEEHPDTLGTLQNLALTLEAQGDLPGARRLYERALEARTRLLGEEHPDTAMTRWNLVLTLRRVDPAAAAPHLIVLRRLSHRPAEGLSAVEKRILAALPSLE